MRPDMVVMLSPVFSRRARVFNAGEAVQLQAVLAKLSVETFHEGIPGRLDRQGEVELQPVRCDRKHIAFPPDAFTRPLNQRRTCAATSMSELFCDAHSAAC